MRQLRAVTFALMIAGWPAAVLGQAVTGEENFVSLDAELRPFLERFEMPALAAAVVKDGKLVAAGAVGTRKIGIDIPVALDDRFHIGSDTKAMTALLAAMLVDDGLLRWDTTVEDIYPELVATMTDGLEGATLEQLLSHQSGIPGDTDAHIPLLAYSVTDERANLDRMRYLLATRLVTQPLSFPPGTGFEYSNLGYTLAGSMMERVTGKTWEELIVERIFEPLGLSSAGFGPQMSLGRIDAPLAHMTGPDGSVQAVLAGPWGDNPLVIGPAGTVHMSVRDFATWAAWNASEGRYGPALVSPETVRKLHTKLVDMPPKPDAPIGTPSAGAYGLGWLTTTVPFSDEPFVIHGGSNTMNLAYIMLQPDKELGFVTMTNIAGEQANEGLLAVTRLLYERFGSD